ncbi:MAG: glutathione S-transferase family protein [Myxococcales bacterium]|nr:glutathione S-transferase family protein [Myxococcales bacterium]
MKLFTFPVAPNPTKLAVYLGEKGLEIPIQLVNLVKGEQHRPEFLAINPLGALPVLELDDGTHLSESLAIIEFLEELHPEPPMIGTDPVERARTRELERMIDLGVLARVARIVHNTRSPLGRPPNEAAAEEDRERLHGALGHLDTRIGDKPFARGETPTIADCTLFAAFRFAEFGKVEIDPGCENLHRWHADFRQRSSTGAPGS